MGSRDRTEEAALVLPGPVGEAPEVDPETGEVIEGWTGTDLAVPDFSPGSLKRYARDKTELDALRMRLGDRVDELVAGDATAKALAAKIAERAAEVAAIEAAFEAAFTPEQRQAQTEPVSLDLGFLRVSWGAAPKRWKQTMTSDQIAKQRPDIAKAIGLRKVAGDPPAARVTIRADRLAAGGFR